MKCIEIMLHDDGSYMVRECEPEMGEGMEGAQTFQSAEEAMQAGMELLASERQGPESGEMRAAMSSGYNKAKGGMMGAKPAGMQYAEE